MTPSWIGLVPGLHFFPVFLQFHPAQKFFPSWVDVERHQPRVDEQVGHIETSTLKGNIQPLESLVAVAVPSVGHGDTSGPGLAVIIDHLLPYRLFFLVTPEAV